MLGYIYIYIYIHVLQSYNIHILYVCAYNNSPTWTKGSTIQDSLCRNLQGVRLAARAKVWFFQGETAKSGRQGRHIEVCIYIYLQDLSQPLKKFLKPIYIKISSHSWAVRPSGSRPLHFFGRFAKALHQVDVEALSHALSGPRTGSSCMGVSPMKHEEWLPAAKQGKANHRL